MRSMATEELYLYGGMDTYATKSALIRKDIVLESVIKSGHFANIYRAKYKENTVVAKTLKAMLIFCCYCSSMYGIITGVG